MIEINAAEAVVCNRCESEELCLTHAGLCTVCCECSICTTCATHVSPSDYCDNCERCQDCCFCRRCERCDEFCTLGQDYCMECSRCNSCCCCCEDDQNDEDDEDDGCNPAVTFTGELGSPVFWTADRRQRKRNPSTRFLSCEVEVADCNKHRDCPVDGFIQKWKAQLVYDGSLPSSGFEVNTAPAAGDLFLDQVGELCDALALQKATVTRDCGLHVHADARDLRHWQLQNLIRLYARVEDALFSVVPHSRRQSTYCYRCGSEYLQGLKEKKVLVRWQNRKGRFYYEDRTRDIKNIIARAVYRKDKEYLRTNSRYRRPEARSKALNLHSWFYRGTVECRLAAGTTNAEKIVNWSLLWGSLVDRSLKLTTQELRDLPEDPWECLLWVAPSEAIRAWLHGRREKFKVIDVVEGF